MSRLKVDNSQKENKSQTRILMVFFVFFCFVVLFSVSNPTTGALRSVFLIFFTLLFELHALFHPRLISVSV